MKKLLFLAMAFGLAACSNDVADVNGGAGNGDTEARYLSVNIAAANGGTRTYDNESGYESGYDENETGESKVNSVRLFFFYNDGMPAPVVVSGATSYVDWDTPADATPDNDMSQSVEHILQAQVVITRSVNKTTGAINDLPQQVIAVINPNAAVLALSETSQMVNRDALMNCINDFTDHGDGEFVMSNSVYADNGKQSAVSLEGHLCATQEAAKDNPVTIYVERLLAKVELNVEFPENSDIVTLSDGTELYFTGQYTDINNPSDDNKIYVRFEGYNVTTTTDKSNLIKEINPTWPNELNNNLFKTSNEPWNYAMFFRSFWAVNPANVGYQWGTYAEDAKNKYPSDDAVYPNVNPALAYKFDFKNPNIIYLPENAGKELDVNNAATDKPTQVIIAATLVTHDGSPIKLTEYAGSRFVETTDDNAKLKTQFLSVLKGGYYCHAGTSAQSNVYREIDINDIEIKTAWDLEEDPTTNMPEKRYYVYAQLTTAAANLTWYSEEPTAEMSDEDFEKITVPSADINKSLKLLGHAKVWTEGKTYYYFEIRHLSAGTNPENTPGYYGVVRNHVYKTTIKSLVGLGTPVYDPDEIIIPEKPIDDEVYIAAEIKILAWRIVNQDVHLEW